MERGSAMNNAAWILAILIFSLPAHFGEAPVPAFPVEFWAIANCFVVKRRSNCVGILCRRRKDSRTL